MRHLNLQQMERTLVHLFGDTCFPKHTIPKKCIMQCVAELQGLLSKSWMEIHANGDTNTSKQITRNAAGWAQAA
jgi:hypothetical protein